MAFNLENMTIDYKKMLGMIPADRATLAQSGQVSDLISSLTPGQLVNLFPRYYRDQLPDIGKAVESLGGVLSDPSRYVGGGGGGGGGGGDGGGTVPYVPPELSTEKQAEILAKAGIDVTAITGAISAEGLSIDDERVKALRNLSDEEMAKSGLERVTSEDGRTIIKQMTPEAQSLSDQEISDRISGKFVAKEDASENQKAVIDFANRWNISPQAAAGVLKIESGVTSDIAGGASGNYHGVFQLQTEQIRGLTEKAGFGSLTPAQYRKLSVADQLKVMDEYYKQAGVTPEFFTGDPQIDASKMWALQLAPGNAKKIDYNDPNAVISQSDQASTIEARNKLVTVGSAGSGSVSGGEEFLGDSLTRIDGNATPDQIAAARDNLIKQEKFKEAEALTRILYKKQSVNSATSSPIENAALDPNAVGGKRKIPLTEHESGIKILNRMNWVSEQVSAETGEKISYRIVSALQPPGKNDAERGGKGTGGYRHGHDVGAADVELIATDANGKIRIINAYSEGKDKEILQSALKHIGKAGFTGVGLGKGYQEGNLHVGFGSPQLWNSAASGDPMKPEYAESIRQGQKEATDQNFNFDEYYAERAENMAQNVENNTATSDAATVAESNVVLAQTEQPATNPVNADPVTSALSRVEGQPSEAAPVPVSPIDQVQIPPDTQQTTTTTTPSSIPAPAVTPAPPVPLANLPEVKSFLQGGSVKMPPGENMAAYNTGTGELEFVSNDKEFYTKDDQGNLRIDPSTIRQEDQKAEIAPAEPQRQEEPNQPSQRRPEQPMPVSTPDPNFLETMSFGSMASSPSQLRALNRAKLYSENSSSLVNGHFS